MKRNLLSIFALGLGLSSFAQIVYTDIADVTLTPIVGRENLPIDLDNDGTIDFTVFAVDTTVENFPTKGVALNMFGNNKVNSSLQTLATGQVLQATAHSAGETINSSLNFMAQSGTVLFPGAGLSVSVSNGLFNAGDFQGSVDQYVAVEFEVGTSQPTTHYGWIRVNVANNAANVIIKDFAYQSTAGNEIRVGDEGNGFTEISEKELANAIVFYGNNELNIKGIDGAYNVSVIDLLGKSISNTRVVNNASINLNSVNNGIYLVQITKGSSVVTKKVYIK